MSRILYITEFAGKLFVRETNQPLLETDELQSIIDRLQEIVDISRSRGLSVQELHLRAMHNKGSEAAASDQWVFPVKRSQTFRSGPCVYFLKVEDRPDEVKIGFTSNLSERAAAIGRSLCSKAQVLAFLKAPYSRLGLIEMFFHDKFRECHTEREWFKREPVIDYLTSIAPDQKAKP